MTPIRSAAEAVAEWRRRHPREDPAGSLIPYGPRPPDPRPVLFDEARAARNRRVAREARERLEREGGR